MSQNLVAFSKYMNHGFSGYISLISIQETKGQLISNCLFVVFTFFQKTNENKSTRSKVEFVRSFFGRNLGLEKSFRISWCKFIANQFWERFKTASHIFFVLVPLEYHKPDFIDIRIMTQLTHHNFVESHFLTTMSFQKQCKQKLSF